MLVRELLLAELEAIEQHFLERNNLSTWFSKRSVCLDITRTAPANYCLAEALFIRLGLLTLTKHAFEAKRLEPKPDCGPKAYVFSVARVGSHSHASACAYACTRLTPDNHC